MSKRNKDVGQLNRGRITLGFAVIGIIFILLSIRLAKIMIVDADELTQKAISQQTMDATIEAKRGIIYDRNGRELATSSICYTLYVFPGNFTFEKTKDEVRKNTTALLNALNIKDQEKRKAIARQLKGEGGIVTVKKYLSKEDAQAVRELGLPGIELAQATKRYYPLGNFASQLLGSVNDDNEGRTGLELEYDEYLSGVNGRWVTNTDVSGNELVEGTERHYEARDGYNIITTIDEAIQFYCEEEAKATYEKWTPKKVMVLAMDPNNGEILASVVYPGFDPNDPFEPQGLSSEDYQAYENMSDEDQTAYLSAMWRNPIVSDTYEPGSTFKLITATSALDEGAISLTDTFYCDHSFRVEDYTLSCWYSGAHGSQTIKQAIENSCNPALADVAARLGATRFMQYINDFGFGGLTGVDYPGEAGALIQSYVGPVELATMGFGQGISITPIQLVTAISSIANGGDLVRPHYVRALTDSKGKVVKKIDTEVVRKVISPETAAEMRDIMEAEVSEGGGGTAKMDGFRIGGKTGTAQKAEAGGYSLYDYYSSFICIAPIDDPKVTLLVVVDSPRGETYGSVVAAPAAKNILENVLRYMSLSPEIGVDDGTTSSTQVSIPDVRDYEYSTAAKTLKSAGLKVAIADGEKGDGKWLVQDQYPKAGTVVGTGTTVYLYRK
ncbi:MAG: PASTA domain-containing protein [Firmicutes bacterium]|nr:PASTA domain-containing protein [Bacillota bacterium]MBR3375185.1 PASTA domain-containing protein [Bacillota bacterium]MBR4023667.1 PASTA domain-containing protein [Bacillota bacterium]